LNSRTYTTTWCSVYYLIVAVVGICQPFIVALDSDASYLSKVVVAFPGAYWLIRDAKVRGMHVPHVIQPGIVSCWTLVVPIYIIRTRGWRGVGYITLHIAGTIMVGLAGHYISAYLLWPVVFPTVGG